MEDDDKEKKIPTVFWYQAVGNGGHNKLKGSGDI